MNSTQEVGVVTYRDYFTAHKAAVELRALVGEGMAVRIERSRFGRGYVLRQFPIELLIDPDYHPNPMVNRERLYG